ncbi:hypothetical protein DCAR_0519290 [Daucus carota subsp. sativus]|uniref:GATA-type domain-containing protein n=1 Tax=Daucus carota subsp. sativus TaxID=79200 RepID=A0AAF0X2G1_DAUCS|nr:hypothetical protein DCAR_0519290 [Daucus carota subsp. sativus]
MAFCRNVTLSGGLPSEHQPYHAPATLGSLDDLFSGNTTVLFVCFTLRVLSSSDITCSFTTCLVEEEDINLEWLSVFIEDCLSTPGNCLLPPASSTLPLDPVPEQPATVEAASMPLRSPPGASRARSKRSRVPCKNPRKSMRWSPDPPLLHQAYWLADSEPIFPKYQEQSIAKEGNMGSSFQGLNGQQPRRCSHCLSQKTPQWRAGPAGPKTLCNACGVRYKSGRLLPEYRPAKSPTFVSYKHSNSHKKVLEMRSMSVLSSFNGD